MIERVSTYQEALLPGMRRLIEYWRDEHEMVKVRERFEKGAVLWIVRQDEMISGFGWSIRGKMVSPYFLPLTPDDAVLFDYLIFEEHRGHGLYSLLLDYILHEIYSEGITRAFIDAFEWNTASIKGIGKTLFRQYGLAEKFYFFGRTIIFWTEPSRP